MGDDGTVGLVDNDVVAKLAVCGLLERLAPTVGLDHICVRGAMRYQMVIKPTRSWRGRLNDSAREGVRAFLEQCHEIPDVSTDFVSRCVEADIDPGEAMLLDVARTDPNSVLITGDKNFLRDLRRSAPLWSDVQHMRGQIVCFEQVLRGLIEIHGFAEICECVQPLCEQDSGVRMVFGPTSEVNPERRCVEGLESGIGEVESVIAHMLRPV